MFKRHSTTTQLIAWLVCLTIILPVQYAAADPWVCLADLDGDGDASSDGEMVGCVPASGTQFCPLQAVDCTQTGTPATCPVAGNACVNGFCDTPGFCHYEDIGLGAWVCELPNGTQGGQYASSGECNSACADFQSPCTGGGIAYTCPLGGGYACVDHFGTQQCSPNACNDLATAPPPTETPLDGAGQMFLDDGPRDVDGNCMGATMIFSGRAMECLPRGLSTAYQDCCDAQDEIYTDSTGSAAQSTLTNKAILATFQAASAAYAAYSGAVAAGATTGAAAQAGANAASNVFSAAFDPTSLAIAIAIALVMEWLTKACPQESLETAALKESGYCVELGSYCKRETLGYCVQRARSQCCFNSKLAKIIHEQGRSQLSTFPDGFGDLNAPNCRGFSPEEFQALDFSLIDLSEYYDDISHASQETMQDTIQQGVERFNDTHGGG